MNRPKSPRQPTSRKAKPSPQVRQRELEDWENERWFHEQVKQLRRKLFPEKSPRQ